MKPWLPTRRLLGVLFLIIAATQVVLGLTAYKGSLSPLGTLLYWSACLLATFAAILCAIVDAFWCLDSSRREQRNLLEQTLRKIDEERDRRKSRPDKSLSKSH